jgi:D-xylose transport system ATP-binding protein
MDVKSNITLAVLNKLLRMGFIDKRKESGVANKTISELKILTPSIYTVLENLSGGNQQKTLVGKWLNSKPTIFIMDEPTRGIDVGTKAEIYQFMKKLISEGVAILLISSELPEIMGMSNRILVMREGSIVAQFDGTKPTREEVMRAALAG